MTQPDAYRVVFTAAARRGMNRLSAEAAVALYEHPTGPVAGNPYRPGKQLDAPLEDLRSTRRGEYRALYVVDDKGTRRYGRGRRSSSRRLPAALTILPSSVAISSRRGFIMPGRAP